MAGIETAFSLIRKNLQTAIAQYGDTLAQGACRDFHEYRKITGIIEGLSIADREVGDIESRYMEE